MTPEEFGEIRSMVKDIHKAMFGNGQPGMHTEFQQMKGVIGLLKWAIGAGSLFAVIALILQLI